MEDNMEPVNPDEFRYLWDGSDKDWVLVYLNYDKPLEMPSFVIENQRTNMACIIEDETIERYVTSKMRSSGTRVVIP